MAKETPSLDSNRQVLVFKEKELEQHGIAISQVQRYYYCPHLPPAIESVIVLEGNHCWVVGGMEGERNTLFGQCSTGVGVQRERKNGCWSSLESLSLRPSNSTTIALTYEFPSSNQKCDSGRNNSDVSNSGAIVE
jgi:hypothetical protein